MAVPYFVQCVDAVKALTERCIGDKPELAAKLRAGVSLRASFGRFCDKDEPFEGIFQNAKPTELEGALLSRKFPADKAQPQCTLLGQQRLIAVIASDNPVKALDSVQIQRLLKKDGAAGVWNTWDKVGGDSRSIKVYDQGPKSWARHILQVRCMAFEEKAGEGIMHGWHDFREDIKTVSDLDAAIAQIRKEPNAICFVAYQGQPIKGAAVLSIKANANSPAISPELKPTIQDDYLLAEPLFLWVHPKAGEGTRGFVEFAASEKGARVLEQYAFITPRMQKQYEGEQRLAELKSGRGTRLSMIGVEECRDNLSELAAEYVKAKALLQLSYVTASADVASIGSFVSGDGGKELLVLADKPSEKAMQAHGQKWNDLQPAENMLAGRAVAIIVNPTSKLESLTLDQVRGIFAGETADWSVFGGAKGPIKCIGLPAADPAAQVFYKECLPAERLKKVALKKDMAEAVAAVSMDASAIAFVDLAAIPGIGSAALTGNFTASPDYSRRSVKFRA